jgi:hypothetical protein
MSWVGDTIYIASVSGGVYLSVRVAYFQLFCTFSPGEAEEDTLIFLERPQKKNFTAWESHSYDSTPKFFGYQSRIQTGRVRQRNSRNPEQPFRI